MANIRLSTNVKLEIESNSEIIKTFNVTYKDSTKKQSRQVAEDNSELMDVIKSGRKIEQKIEAIKTKIDAFKALGKNKEILTAQNQLDKLYIEQDKLEDKIDDLGGIDSLADTLKATYDNNVGGADKDELEEFINEHSDYQTVLNALAKDAKEQLGKQ